MNPITVSNLLVAFGLGLIDGAIIALWGGPAWASVGIGYATFVISACALSE